MQFVAETIIFSYREALALFPAVRERTQKAVREIQEIYALQPTSDEAAGNNPHLELEINAVVEQWAEEITALGCEVKGLWLVDWDSGDGYYCWRYPEETIGYFHSYEDGFAGRLPIV